MLFEGWEAVLTASVLVVVLFALIRELVKPEFGLMGGVAVLLVAGVINPNEAFSGFSNSAVLTVGALFVVAAGVQRTEALSFLDKYFFSAKGGISAGVARLTAGTAFMSAFLNNTPIVAMLTPRVQAWANMNDLAPSKFLIPLSFATIAGGMTTLIGTSTNIVVAGLLEGSGHGTLGMFHLTWVGLPAAILVLIYLATIGHRLLPDRRKKDQGRDDGLSECLFELRISASSPLAGSTVEAGGLRNLGDAYLTHVRRNGTLLEATPQQTLREGDKLAFVGSVRMMEELLRRPGLDRVIESEKAAEYESLPIFEAVVAPTSNLVGKTLREVAFRENYRGVVLAIQRKDERLVGALGRTPIKPGDLLLIEAEAGFQRRWNASRDEFYLVAARSNTQRKSQKKKAPVAFLILLAMVIAFSFDLLPIVTAAFVAALAMVATRCLSAHEAARAIDFRVLVVIAAAFGLGIAVQNSGLAGTLASGILAITGSLGPAATVLALYIATNIMTELITNNAAAILMLPVGIAAADSMGADPIAFAVVVAIAASASFLTPLGYQTNLMVMAPGSYRFRDYYRVGAPVSLIVMITTTVIVTMHWL